MMEPTVPGPAGPATRGPSAARQETARAFEALIGRLLILLTYVAVSLLVVGVCLMIVNGISPLDVAPSFDLATLVDSVVALAPAAFLWLGVTAVIATPISRVVGAAIGFARTGDRPLVGISIAILVVIAVGIATALGSEA